MVGLLKYIDVKWHQNEDIDDERKSKFLTLMVN